MLNELFSLTQSLRESGIPLSPWHDQIEPCPNGTGIEIRLSPDGKVVGVSLAETAGRMRYAHNRSSKSAFFPAFNVARPYVLREGQSPSTLRGILRQPGATLRDAREMIDSNWPSAIIGAIARSLAAGGSLCARLPATACEYTASLRELASAVAQVDVESLHAQLQVFLFAIGGDGAINLVATSTKGTPAKVVLIFELEEWRRHGFPVAHPRVWQAINALLLAEQQGGASTDVATEDLFGAPVADPSALMPEANVPVLGKVKLRSLNKDIPCQARWGLVGSDTCPLGESLQLEFRAALEWILHRGRQGQTWEDVSASRGDGRRSVLIAYPVTLSETGNLPFAQLLGGLETQGESLFTISSRVVVSALRRMSPDAVQVHRGANLGVGCNDCNDCNIAVWTLERLNQGAVRLASSQRFSADHLLEAARTWAEAAHRWTGADDAPTPAQVVRICNRPWLGVPPLPRTCPRTTLSDGLTLLLGWGSPAGKATARRILRHCLDSSTPLLLAWASAMTAAPTKRFRHEREARIAMSSLAIAMERSDEESMEQTEDVCVHIGGLCGLICQAQLSYCQQERKNKIPPRLLGEQLVSTAMERPALALRRMRSLVPLYCGRAPETVLRRIAEVSHRVAQGPLPDRLSDSQAARVLLGYLAQATGLAR